MNNTIVQAWVNSVILMTISVSATTTAAAAAFVPFDRIFKLSGEELKGNYRVNLSKILRKENEAIFGFDFDFDARGNANKEAGSKSSSGTKKKMIQCTEDGDDDDTSEECVAANEAEEDIEDIEGNESDREDIVSKLQDGDLEKEQKEENYTSKSSKTKSKSKKKSSSSSRRAAGEFEYDLDDPFIDDEGIDDVYQSVFDLMRSAVGNGGCDNEQDNDNTDTENEHNVKKRISVKEPNFFVYKGALSNEILKQEFDISPEDFEEESEGSDVNEEEAEEGREQNSTVTSKKRRNPTNNGNSNSTKATSKSSGGSQKKKVKVEKEKQVKVKEKKVKIIKEGTTKKQEQVQKDKDVNSIKNKTDVDVIAQTAKRIDDMFALPTSITTATKTMNTPIFNVTGVDANMLELREVLKRFRDAAVGTAFSPGKFPSVLRPRLNETLCTTLRAFRTVAPTEPLPHPKLFPALASFLPFSPPALMKLINKKIIGPLKDSLCNAELPKLYVKWGEILKERIVEFESTLQCTSTTVVSEVVPALDLDSTACAAPTATTASSIMNGNEKKKLKFTDEMRILIFDITRAEIDLNNLVILMLSNPSFAASEASNDTLGLPKPQSDLSLKKIIYQKLIQCDPTASNHITTSDLSREYGVQKRKHEKRISKLAGDILFGESEIEELLSITIQKKDITVVVEGSEVVVDQTSLKQNLPENDPLKSLFDEDAKTTTFTMNESTVPVRIQSTSTTAAPDS